MKTISHESDQGFQKVAIIMAALTVLYGILSVSGSTRGFRLEQHFNAEMGMLGFVTINLIFSYTKGIMRFYVGTDYVENMYAAFLATGLLGVITILADVLYTLYSII